MRLLTGLVRCGCCGGGMTIIGRERYACSARKEQGTCTNATSIKAQELEQLAFRKNLMRESGELTKLGWKLAKVTESDDRLLDF